MLALETYDWVSGSCVLVLDNSRFVSEGFKLRPDVMLGLWYVISHTSLIVPFPVRVRHVRSKPPVISQVRCGQNEFRCDQMLSHPFIHSNSFAFPTSFIPWDPVTHLNEDAWVWVSGCVMTFLVNACEVVGWCWEKLCGRYLFYIPFSLGVLKQNKKYWKTNQRV